MFVREVRLDRPPYDKYPFDLPVLRSLAASGGLDLDTPVTFFAGDNGTGKSTLVEGLAVACGFNPEGGTQGFRFATRATESVLGDHLVVSWRAGGRPRSGFFLRAESFYNVATYMDEAGADPAAPGGVSLHERSHGESFLDLVGARFEPGGLYILDEPEAALSAHGCLALLRHIAVLAGQGAQFVIATHSPILLAVPGARILQIDAAGSIGRVAYDEADAVVLTRGFLADPARHLHHLLADDEPHSRS